MMMRDSTFVRLFSRPVMLEWAVPAVQRESDVPPASGGNYQVDRFDLEVIRPNERGLPRMPNAIS